jgi:hypothetical protein
MRLEFLFIIMSFVYLIVLPLRVVLHQGKRGLVHGVSPILLTILFIELPL